MVYFGVEKHKRIIYCCRLVIAHILFNTIIIPSRLSLSKKIFFEGKSLVLFSSIAGILTSSLFY